MRLAERARSMRGSPFNQRADFCLQRRQGRLEQWAQQNNHFHQLTRILMDLDIVARSDFDFLGQRGKPVFPQLPAFAFK